MMIIDDNSDKIKIIERNVNNEYNIIIRRETKRD